MCSSDLLLSACLVPDPPAILGLEDPKRLLELECLPGPEKQSGVVEPDVGTRRPFLSVTTLHPKNHLGDPGFDSGGNAATPGTHSGICRGIDANEAEGLEDHIGEARGRRGALKEDNAVVRFASGCWKER